jgi:hypothetical protein
MLLDRVAIRGGVFVHRFLDFVPRVIVARKNARWLEFGIPCRHVFDDGIIIVRGIDKNEIKGMVESLGYTINQKYLFFN